MWVWIIVGLVVLAAVVYALWPRKGGIDDARAFSARQSTIGSIEKDHNTNRNQFPPW
ncbi:hypothetical protein GON03_20175 [Nocardioides sp. MAH-18]|uniref:Uncharacterized protein n=1 Tax=Nocardioides agri TaxID=2682843 RepID=A0A6L6XXI9_9ACTN|nr:MULTISPECIES: hypothetical protein [unclassified Nocardioides]MBA2952342.1 hypothetical protein [Nocardioides sp. CGMCC 1.13656]MVQ51502.1 hypothetical protein [Nocardioides sp. MAH-18]